MAIAPKIQKNPPLLVRSLGKKSDPRIIQLFNLRRKQIAVVISRVISKTLTPSSDNYPVNHRLII